MWGGLLTHRRIGQKAMIASKKKFVEGIVSKWMVVILRTDVVTPTLVQVAAATCINVGVTLPTLVQVTCLVVGQLEDSTPPSQVLLHPRSSPSFHTRHVHAQYGIPSQDGLEYHMLQTLFPGLDEYQRMLQLSLLGPARVPWQYVHHAMSLVPDLGPFRVPPRSVSSTRWGEGIVSKWMVVFGLMW